MMPEQKWPIAKEGLPFLIPPAVVTLFFAVMGWLALTFLGFLLTFFIAFFFRNPKRKIPDTNNVILSPADGTIIDVVEQTAARVFMPVTVGGGVRTLEDIRALLNAGADKVSINTAAVQRPEFVREAAQKFGTQCIVVAIDAEKDDAKRRHGLYRLSTSGPPQHESDSAHAQAPSSLSAQERTTWISSSQFSQTYTSPAFISLHAAIVLTTFPSHSRQPADQFRRLLDSLAALS